MMSTTEYEPENFFVLQVDVSNHTEWLRKDKTDRTKWLKKHYARKELGKQIIRILKQYEFNRCLWNGDGGIFFCKESGKQNYDFVVNAGDELFKLFEMWQGDHKDLDTQSLGLRVSADLELIIAEDEPSFWTSYNLNRFVKDEKTITIRGFAISQTIKNKLIQFKDRFTDQQLIDRFNNVYFFIDSEHRYNEKVKSKCNLG